LRAPTDFHTLPLHDPLPIWRTAPYVWQHPREAAPELLELAAATDGPIALLFGPESVGLSNEELDLCDRVLTVPTSSAYSSLNLADRKSTRLNSSHVKTSYAV